MGHQANTSGQVDMLHGPLAGKIILFSLPLIASGILQHSFNAIDVAVIGQYSTSQAIAAVGSNSPVISMLVNLFLGISIGANVVIATYLGQKNHNAVRRCISTSAILAIISGFILTILGTSLARPILEAMSAPADVIDLASLYLRIYFCGMPFIMIYNFGSAIMRSVGDTKLPFYSLLIATLFNLGLDWLFVAVFDWGVAGVAWATVIANAINASIIVYFLSREKDPVTLTFTQWTFSTPDFNNMLRIGIPAGLQGVVFSISNIFIQSSINSFGSDAIAGSAAELTYEAYCYYIIAAFTSATMAFTGQNYGASQPERCKRVVRICLLYSVVLCGLANLFVIWQEKACMSVFTTDPEVIRYASIRFHTVLIFQSISSSYEIFGAYMRGLGYSLTPMFLTIFGTCILRLAWIWSLHGTQYSFGRLLAIYPISWSITGLAVITAAICVQRRVFSRMRAGTSAS